MLNWVLKQYNLTSLLTFFKKLSFISSFCDILFTLCDVLVFALCIKSFYLQSQMENKNVKLAISNLLRMQIIARPRYVKSTVAFQVTLDNTVAFKVLWDFQCFSMSAFYLFQSAWLPCSHRGLYGPKGVSWNWPGLSSAAREDQR